MRCYAIMVWQPEYCLQCDEADNCRKLARNDGVIFLMNSMMLGMKVKQFLEKLQHLAYN